MCNARTVRTNKKEHRSILYKILASMLRVGLGGGTYSLLLCMIELMDRRGEGGSTFYIESTELHRRGAKCDDVTMFTASNQTTGITEKGKKHFFVIFLCFFHISAIEYIHYNKRKLSSSSPSWWGGAGAATGNEKGKKKRM